MNYKQKNSLHDAIVQFINDREETVNIASFSANKHCIRLSVVRFGDYGIAGYVQHFVGGVCIDTKEQPLEFQHDVNALVSLYVGAISVL